MAAFAEEPGGLYARPDVGQSSRDGDPWPPYDDRRAHVPEPTAAGGPRADVSCVTPLGVGTASQDTRATRRSTARLEPAHPRAWSTGDGQARSELVSDTPAAAPVGSQRNSRGFRYIRRPWCARSVARTANTASRRKLK